MNWGWKLTIVYVAFMAMILTLVVKSSREKVDLVTADYYAQELRYQERIDAISRTASLRPVVEAGFAEGYVEFLLPADHVSHIQSGTVRMYRPSDSALDRTYALSPSDSGAVRIADPSWKSGYYVLQAEWTADGKTYFYEKSIRVP